MGNLCFLWILCEIYSCFHTDYFFSHRIHRIDFSPFGRRPSVHRIIPKIKRKAYAIIQELESTEFVADFVTTCTMIKKNGKVKTVFRFPLSVFRLYRFYSAMILNSAPLAKS